MENPTKTDNPAKIYLFENLNINFSLINLQGPLAEPLLALSRKLNEKSAPYLQNTLEIFQYITKHCEPIVMLIFKRKTYVLHIQKIYDVLKFVANNGQPYASYVLKQENFREVIKHAAKCSEPLITNLIKNEQLNASYLYKSYDAIKQAAKMGEPLVLSVWKGMGQTLKSKL